MYFLFEHGDIPASSFYQRVASSQNKTRQNSFRWQAGRFFDLSEMMASFTNPYTSVSWLHDPQV